jgi:ArsR family transcriptional regulator
MTAAIAPLEQRLLALADATRLRLLRVLAGHELTVAELCAVLQLPQSTVSRHLKVLGDEGWAASRRDGTSRFYRLRPQDLEPASERLWRVVAEDVAALPTAGADDARLMAVLAARQSRSQAFFAATGAGWDRVRRELFGERAPLAALAGLLPDDAVVGDLGCGTGELTAVLAPFVGRVIAVDAAASMLAAARERLAGQPNVDLRLGGLEALPVADGELDAAVVMLVLHHLPEPRIAFAELARVLCSGGRALIVEMAPHDHEEYRDRMGHVWLGFEPSDLTSWLFAAGFHRIRITPLPLDPAAKGPALQAVTAVRS